MLNDAVGVLMCHFRQPAITRLPLPLQLAIAGLIYVPYSRGGVTIFNILTIRPVGIGIVGEMF